MCFSEYISETIVIYHLDKTKQYPEGSHHKKKRKKIGKNSLMGGRGQNEKNKVPIPIWEHRKLRGGLNFSEMSELKVALRHNP